MCRQSPWGLHINAPYQSIATSDGWVNVGAANQANFLGMLDVIEAKHLSEDERFTSNVDRMAHRAELIKELETVFMTRSTDEWVQLLNDAGIPAGPILEVGQMHEDEQALSRDMVTEVNHPVAGIVKTLGAPVKFHGTPGGVKRAAPVLGQHSEEVSTQIGYSLMEIQQLVDNAIVA